MTTQEREIINAAITALQQIVGLPARLAPVRADLERDLEDATIEIEANRRKYRFAAEVKTVDRFETPAMVKAGVTDTRRPPLLIAPYITREVAGRCRELHLPFIDTAGNAYLEGPGLFIYVVGQPRPDQLKQDRFRALNPAGLQVVFALLCQPELMRANYRKIAAAAKVALGTLGPVMKDLEGRGLIRLNPATNRQLLDPPRMLQEWVTYYPTTLRPKLNPRRFHADPERLQLATIKKCGAYWGGEGAAERLTQFLKPEHFTIYARGPIAELVAANRMRADRNGNVEVLEAFWDFETRADDLVPPVLVYADLLATNDGRNAEAARMIYEQRIEPTFRQNK
ncbi:MAG: hypothetical protein K2X03_02615 [Bryobacteraceae bacterium]|nr:hypothetical protein [Bryobacteraceae bacterium]